ncbi:GTPase Era [Coxiella burnetii]|uniref:GTPase Era n=2 Tax=Coxiella burnetii TaxID=777 RepID=ERA_COXBU|nr:GTPase Era [Coxiella burnetii]NP_820485.1 GTP-binding protein [Coxiella burnetii RSA 493]A9N941.1 RecName: Full=GTPase Era [Coxiella burnetii RSA 331]P51836.1 RecName: Full=GTPase Era [Coxiella burnetii RSA 493]AAA69691.1 GTP-binding protein [Coxiella burnetii]AAO90999.1 GTP-binding protein [Coxiella burnetii RSA 493]ABX77380.1 GTP-binding protein Era [Coxiella burnetii RSA 331]AML48595.1 GTPase Era [Coxiella burnetii]AML54583.1 GTPase Era [Coxiella burnetii]
MKPTYCGYAAIIGRPNVGKSTLLNQLLEQKISITSRKPQTTRYQILGVKTFKDIQVIYVDTPGLHAGTERTINRYMNRTARGALRDVDAIVFVIEPHWESQDAWVLDNLKEIETPVFLVINKVDKIKNRAELLPLIEKVSSLYAFQKITPLSAKTGDQVGTLEQAVHQLMPESPFYFPPEQVTDRSDQFMASEIIREKLMRLLGQEIPYSLAVTLIEFRKEEKIIRISAVIWVEKKSQKGIVIGKGGERLKRVGTNARLDMEKWFGKRVFLQLWVKVKSGWADNERLLRELGFEE